MLIVCCLGTSRKRSTPKPPPYYKGAHGVIIVYDVTNEKSFENVSDLWLKDINAHADKENVQKILVANKCDMTRYSSVETSNTGKLVSATTVFIYEWSREERFDQWSHILVVVVFKKTFKLIKYYFIVIWFKFKFYIFQNMYWSFFLKRWSQKC